MKVLIDAQLPRRLCRLFVDFDCDSVHTLDLERRNQTSDDEIRRLADEQGRIVVTKDADFVSSHVLYGTPAKLLLIATGNVRNSELEILLAKNLPQIKQAFNEGSFIELNGEFLIVHG